VDLNEIEDLEAAALRVVTPAREHPMMIGEDEAAGVEWAEECLVLIDDVRRLRNAEADLTAACRVYRERAEAAAYLLVGDDGLPRRHPSSAG
jgi:hypothetical protein